MRIALVVCLALLAGVCGCTNKPDVEAARSVSDQIGKALSTSNPEKLGADFADDALLVRPNEPPLIGREAIVSRYAIGFQQIDYNVSLLSEELRSAGEIIIDRGSFKGSIKSKDGRTSSPVSGKYLHVLKWQAANRWKIWNAVWEFDQPLPATSCQDTGARSCCCKDVGGNDCIVYTSGCGGAYPIPILLP